MVSGLQAPLTMRVPSSDHKCHSGQSHSRSHSCSSPAPEGTAGTSPGSFAAKQSTFCRGAPAGHQRGCPGPGGRCMMEAKPPRRAGCAPASAAARCEKTHARTLAAPWQAAWKMPALADTVSKEDSFQNLKQSSGGCPRGRGPAPTSPSAGTSRQQRAAAPGSKHSRHSPGKHFARLLRLWLLFLQEKVQPTNK